MEYYKPAYGYPNYEVSTEGNIRNIATGVVRKQTNRKGYRKIRINDKDVSMHIIVAETFLGGPHPGMEVDHIDGNKANNRVDNLEWVTGSENVKRAYMTGLKHPSGGRSPDKIYDVTEDTVYESASECARYLDGTKQGVIYAVKHNGKYKGHLLEYYND